MANSKNDREHEAMNAAIKALLSIFEKEEPEIGGKQNEKEGMSALRQILRSLKAEINEPPEEISDIRERMVICCVRQA